MNPCVFSKASNSTRAQGLIPLPIIRKDIPGGVELGETVAAQRTANIGAVQATLVITSARKIVVGAMPFFSASFPKKPKPPHDYGASSK